MATACRRKELRGETVPKVGGAPTHRVAPGIELFVDGGSAQI